MCVFKTASVLVFVAFSSISQAHDIYHDWVNKLNQGCCNNTDCYTLDPGRKKVVDKTIYVYIQGVGGDARGKGEWCPVLPHHYLSKGNAPNGSSAHVCVSGFYKGKTTCEQFICFQDETAY
jgi:hypothetical protein